MNKRIVKKLDVLCAKAEQLQAELRERKDGNDAPVYKVRYLIGQAKDKLLEALNEAQDAE